MSESTVPPFYRGGYFLKQEILERKAKLFSLISRAPILFAGVGIGKDLSLLPSWVSEQHVEVFGCDIEPCPESEEAAREAGLNYRFVQVDIQELNRRVRPGSIGTFVCSFTTCSITDPVLAYQQMLDALYEGGELFYMEHTRGEGRVLQWIQQAMQGMWQSGTRQHTGDAGCNLLYEPGPVIEAAGFSIQMREHFTVPSLMPAGYVECGTAIKS